LDAGTIVVRANEGTKTPLKEGTRIARP